MSSLHYPERAVPHCIEGSAGEFMMAKLSWNSTFHSYVGLLCSSIIKKQRDNGQQVLSFPFL
jgi:hypothetical protein